MSTVYIERIIMGGDDSYPEKVTLYSSEEIATLRDGWGFISMANVTQPRDPGTYFVYEVQINRNENLLRNAFQFLKRQDFSIFYDKQDQEADHFNALVIWIMVDNQTNQAHKDDDLFCSTPAGPTLK